MLDPMSSSTSNVAEPEPIVSKEAQEGISNIYFLISLTKDEKYVRALYI